MTEKNYNLRGMVLLKHRTNKKYQSGIKCVVDSRLLSKVRQLVMEMEWPSYVQAASHRVGTPNFRHVEVTIHIGRYTWSLAVTRRQLIMPALKQLYTASVNVADGDLLFAIGCSIHDESKQPTSLKKIVERQNEGLLCIAHELIDRVD